MPFEVQATGHQGPDVNERLVNFMKEKCNHLIENSENHTEEEIFNLLFTNADERDMMTWSSNLAKTVEDLLIKYLDNEDDISDADICPHCHMVCLIAIENGCDETCTFSQVHGTCREFKSDYYQLTIDLPESSIVDNVDIDRLRSQLKDTLNFDTSNHI